MSLNKEIDQYVITKHHPQLNSVILWQDGQIIAERYYNKYNENTRNWIKSVVKSILSIAVGIAFDQGLLPSLDEPIYKYLPEFAEFRDPRHKIITIRHLLTMSSGILWNGGVHYHCPMMQQMKRSGNWIDYIADCMVKNVPGTEYLYKEWDVILLARILDKVAGDAFDFINDNLYSPLGIKSDRWYRSPDGAYYSVALDETLELKSNLTAREMLSIGILFYQGGVFGGKQIISKEYITMAIAPSPRNQGYGYLWWRGEGWYGCKGFGGQSITVVPEKKKIAVTQATPTNRSLSYDDLVWDILLQ